MWKHAASSGYVKKITSVGEQHTLIENMKVRTARNTVTENEIKFICKS